MANIDDEPFGSGPSIPILRVGVQLKKVAPLLQLQRLQFPYCAWEFNIKFNLLTTGLDLQFPYCAWEFNAAGGGFDADELPSIPILRVGVQWRTTATRLGTSALQFPYCAWEFNGIPRATDR